MTVFDIVVCPRWSCIDTADPSGPTIMSTSSSMPDHVLLDVRDFQPVG